jgi:hypothetical protein
MLLTFLNPSETKNANGEVEKGTCTVGTLSIQCNTYQRIVIVYIYYRLLGSGQ